MALNSFDYSSLELKRITDFIAASFVFYLKNFRHISHEIILPQIFSIIGLIFIFFSLDGEFNLTYFLSQEGKLFLAILSLVIVANQFNAAYKSFRIVCLNNLELSIISIKLRFLLIIILRFLLMILAILSIYIDENFPIIFIAFLAFNSLFYRILFGFKQKILGIKDGNEKFLRKFVVYFRATILIFLNRFLITFIPLIATFSIFIVYEFVRILITKKIFFFVYDRLNEFSIFMILMLTFFLLINPFQYISLMIFYDYHYIHSRSPEQKNQYQI